ncbi:glutathione S-transferase family protein [Caulobacter sp. NIBR2454]|uniref:glutathione S-transferase family protein n=1 Tax=Caulobacter sp. NIBR2454 TaxID=3015996 RepID=UPI0022B61BFD|nr:glutathione S-transferase N-terminal domain-containing protein [Caulobacter sp. NIBR2454]
MQLLYSPTSPFARKVRVAMIELGLEDRIQLAAVDPWTDETLRGQNPLSKVPTLVTGDGEIIFDSRVICEYLDEIAGGGRLFPATGPDRWRALTAQALADGIGDAAVRVVAQEKRPAAEQHADQIARQRAAILAALDSLEDDAFDGRFGIGQIAVAAQLGYLDFRKVLDWRENRPILTEWYERVRRRPSMKASEPVE